MSKQDHQVVISSFRLGALLVITLLALFEVSLLAQTNTILGELLDHYGEPIKGARVTMDSSNYKRSEETKTDNEGRFVFVGLWRGSWNLIIQKPGYKPSQASINLRQSGLYRISTVITPDPFNPPAPSTGFLAGIQGQTLQADLDAAHKLFDDGHYDSAIDAYVAMLERLPQLTSLNIQIGHAYRNQQNYQQAMESYQKVQKNSSAAEEAKMAIQALKEETNRDR